MDYRWDPDYEICLCKHVSTTALAEIIKKEHIRTMEELIEKGNVGHTCGGCREDLAWLLEEMNKVTDTPK